jgi:hypothetical protein
MRIAAALLVALSTVGSLSPALAGEEEAGPASTAINLAFKLDPRLSGATYGGERWVSPSRYQGSSGQNTVEAKASAIDTQGRPTRAIIDWKPSDPEMILVSPARGEQVKITVRRTGESSLVLTSGAVSKRLAIRAVDRNGVWQVTITQ